MAVASRAQEGDNFVDADVRSLYQEVTSLASYRTCGILMPSACLWIQTTGQVSIPPLYIVEETADLPIVCTLMLLMSCVCIVVGTILYYFFPRKIEPLALLDLAALIPNPYTRGNTGHWVTSNWVTILRTIPRGLSNAKGLRKYTWLVLLYRRSYYGCTRSCIAGNNLRPLPTLSLNLNLKLNQVSIL